MIFDHYEAIRVVNLPERVDRKREMEAEFARIGLAGDPRISFYPARRMADSGPFRRVGSYGNFLSHLDLLEEALNARKSVVILEDDCDFLPAIAEYEPANGVLPDLFYGGYYTSNEDDIANSDIVGSHFMGFSVKAVEAAVPYLKAYLKPDFPPDPKAAADPLYDHGIRPPIDGAFVWFRRRHTELTTEFAMLSSQRPSATDVGDRKWFDDVPLLRQIASTARRVLQ